MASGAEIDRALAAVGTTLNDLGLEEFDRGRVREIVAGSRLTVDDGGGLHDESGTRVGCVRKAPGGEWIVERQNTAADNPDAVVPSPAPGGEQH
jgi:hypothetical protein